MQTTLEGVGERSRALIARDEKALSPSYKREYPLVVERAQGSELWDVDGRRYIDFMAGVAVHNVGHRHPRVEAAVKEQVEKFWHICLSDFYYPQAIELAEMLQRVAPMDDETLIYFGNSGAEAVEAAVKLAMHYTGRTRFVGFQGAFHGRTLGALSFTASKNVQRAGFLPGVRVHHVPFPNEYRPLLVGEPGETYAETVIRYIEEQLFHTLLPPGDVAAIVVEPIQGEGGYIVPAPGFFPRLREICDRYGILLIVDEIQSGAGRTGRWWAVEHEGVEPDIVCFAKGVTSGLPIGGIIARKELMSWPAGGHGSTFGGNPVAAVAALETLRVIEEEGLLAQAEATGNHIMARLDDMADRHPSIGQVRGRGLMIGIEFVLDRISKRRAIALRNDVVENAFVNGLLLIPCGTNAVRMTPPLNIPSALVEEGLEIFEHVLAVAETRHL